MQCISGADGLVGDRVYLVVGKAGGQTSRLQKGKDDSEHSSKAALPLLPNPHLTECLLVQGLKPSIYTGPASRVLEHGGWGRRVEETLVVWRACVPSRGDRHCPAALTVAMQDFRSLLSDILAFRVFPESHV